MGRPPLGREPAQRGSGPLGPLAPRGGGAPAVRAVGAVGAAAGLQPGVLLPAGAGGLLLGRVARDKRSLEPVLGRGAFYCLEGLRRYVGLVMRAAGAGAGPDGEGECEGEAAWRATLDALSSLGGSSESATTGTSGDPDEAGREEEGSLPWYRYKLYECYGVQASSPALPERHRFPVPLSFDGERVDAAPFGWVDAFDGRYEYNFWAWQPTGTRDGASAQGIWSLLGVAMWDAPRVEALKTLPLLSRCKTGWARSDTLGGAGA